MKYGALEAGGTKMLCAVCDDMGNVIKKSSFPTKSPEETLPVLLSYFESEKVDSLGIGCFGPIDLDEASPLYGSILNTPKVLWQNCNIVSYFQNHLGIPVGFDTDVNASMLGEATYGAAKNVDHGIYVTIGTGIGIGVMIDRKLHHGMLHPEGGHILLSRQKDDNYLCNCPFHSCCFEGMAAGPALMKRFGKKADELSKESKVWELEADYIAQALVNYIMILSPQRIILGGGVMHQKQLFPLIREKLVHYLGGYISTKWLENMDSYISQPGLGDDQGIIGAALLGKQKLESSRL